MNFLKNSSNIQKLILYVFSVITLIIDFAIVLIMYVTADTADQMQNNFYESIFLIIILSSIIMSVALIIHFIFGLKKANQVERYNDHENAFRDETKSQSFKETLEQEVLKNDDKAKGESNVNNNEFLDSNNNDLLEEELEEEEDYF